MIRSNLAQEVDRETGNFNCARLALAIMAMDGAVSMIHAKRHRIKTETRTDTASCS